jgi:hypothetical protein
VVLAPGPEGGISATFMSLDGVISAPQEWSLPYWNE